ncbi:hypothetical protein [Engelhardtia mirabilis]|uniref:ELWxxDGT repeat protein n=1 Tax=Engelhardtia mirabilis TaxID=2528011 RepID=A0A518BDP4_9BACT|nr:hypothetical protein Pla133_01740 [Planctomycetes bacterium Pla133]QDU99436.1 hypothetical protein Pla86_01740 [Planctomycetes bacterium Pla86]
MPALPCFRFALPLAAALLAGPWSPSSAAQSPVQLAVDFNQQVSSGGGSEPCFLASDGQRSYFWAKGPGDGDDLWVTDGTPAGTHLVAPDLTAVSYTPNPLLDGGVVLPSGRAIVMSPNSVVPALFYPTLFGTDGTAGGTEPLFESQPGDLHARSDLVEFLGEGWFVGEGVPQPFGPVAGRLWRSDGTSAGTRPAFTGPSEPTNVRGRLVVGGGRLYFVDASDDSVVGDPPRLLSTDGSGAPPTVLFTGIPDGDIFVSNYLPTTGEVLFTSRFLPATSSGTYVNEWRTVDAGGAGGGEVLADAVYEPSHSAVVQSLVYFPGVNSLGEIKLFVSDGTAAGTFTVPDNTQGLIRACEAAPLVPYNGGVVFIGGDPFVGFEPRFADSSGIVLLVDATPGLLPVAIPEFVEWNGELYFHMGVAQSIPGRLYRTDGTAAGTVPVLDAATVGSAPLYATGRTQAGIVYEFDIKTGLGSEPWVVGGDTVKFVADIDPNSSSPSFPGSLVRLGPELILVASTAFLERSLYSADGTAAGTQTLATLDLGSGSSGVGGAIVLGDRVVMPGGLGGIGRDLLITDGSTAGTIAVDLLPGPDSSIPTDFLRVGSRAYFVARTGPSGVGRLWVTDGTAAGTVQVADVQISTTTGVRPLFDAEGVGGAEVFFIGYDASGWELWRSDGTASGTLRVTDIAAGVASSDPRDGAVVGGELCFSATDAAHGREVWATDGTAAGTRLVVDIAPGPANGVADLDGVAFDGRLVVASAGGSLGLGPIAVDPASGQVQRLVEPALAAANPGLAGKLVGDFARLGDALLFATDGPTPTGGEARLWRATSATAFATPTAVDVLDNFAINVTDLGGGFGLVGGTSGEGTEPWVLRPDGPATQLIDLYPGVQSSNPGYGVRVGSQVLFPADSPIWGYELFKVSVATLGANVAVPIEGGCAAAGAAPVLAPVGRPTLGADFDVRIEGAPVAAPLVWAVDTSFAPVSLSGPCAPLLLSPTFLALGQTNGAGQGLLDLAVPADPVLLDAVLVFQTLVVEVPGPFLGIASLSDGLEVVVGP